MKTWENNMPEVITSKTGSKVELWSNREESDRLFVQDNNRRVCQEDQARKELCESLGLGYQVERILAFDPGIIYHEMTLDERNTWKKFLPTSYRKGKWNGYNFDTIPIEVLHEIDFASKTELFSRLEIWTPEETTNPDPIVVGITVAGRHFLIARWGESLIPFQEIKQKMAWSMAFDNLTTLQENPTFLHLSLSLAASLAGILLIVWLSLSDVSCVWWLLPIIVLSIPGSFICRLWREARRILS